MNLIKMLVLILLVMISTACTGNRAEPLPTLASFPTMTTTISDTNAINDAIGEQSLDSTPVTTTEPDNSLIRYVSAESAMIFTCPSLDCIGDRWLERGAELLVTVVDDRWYKIIQDDSVGYLLVGDLSDLPPITNGATAQATVGTDSSEFAATAPSTTSNPATVSATDTSGTTVGSDDNNTNNSTVGQTTSSNSAQNSVPLSSRNDNAVQINVTPRSTASTPLDERPDVPDTVLTPVILGDDAPPVVISPTVGPDEFPVMDVTPTDIPPNG
ncbi:MAG: hypothetical protein AAF846_16925 [Chloroflexota bacterium]